MITLKNTRQLVISTAGNRATKTWKKELIYWHELVDKLGKPLKSPEKLEDYLKLPKAKQDNLKDVGGFVGGELIDNQRIKGAKTRDIVALDLDNIDSGMTDDILKRISGLGCAYVVYSTRKHSSNKPRLRVLIPSDRSMKPDEYEPVARKLASIIGIQLCDPTTFQVTRLMYWPSCSSDSIYIYIYEDKPFMSVDGVLSMYNNWQNVEEWPRLETENKNINLLRKKQQNPLEKEGIIGAFCRSYNILEAIEKYIPDAYDTTTNPNRLTYTRGSTFGGAVLYEDGNFLYSNHATDPASQKLCNSYDLVRLHLFKDLDYGGKEGTPLAKYPSFEAMKKLALNDKNIKAELAKERITASNDFAQEYIDAKTGEIDLEWMSKLKISDNGGYCKSTENIMLILANDPTLKGKIVYDEFSNRGLVLGALPWNKEEKKRNWTDVDDAQLRILLETRFGITGASKINDALLAHSYNHKINEVADYLLKLEWDGVKRLDTLLIDYFGAADNSYTRESIRKMLTAAVARAVEPGVKFDNMLILAGKQGCGKSTFIRYLGKEWFSDSLYTFEGKEASEQIQGCFVIELGELVAMARSDTNAIKQFISKTEDIFREAYGRRTGRYPRRCVFFGTTNETEILRDNTGNRRFWPVTLGITEPTKNVFDDLPGEVDQIWAEAVSYWRLGEPLYLSRESKDLSEEEQEAYKEVSVKEGIIREFLEKELPEDWDKRGLEDRKTFLLGNETIPKEIKMVKRDKICALEVWVECFGKDAGTIKRIDSIEINSILSNIKGWTRSKNAQRFGPYGVQKGFSRSVTFP